MLTSNTHNVHNIYTAGIGIPTRCLYLYLTPRNVSLHWGLHHSLSSANRSDQIVVSALYASGLLAAWKFYSFHYSSEIILDSTQAALAEQTECPSRAYPEYEIANDEERFGTLSSAADGHFVLPETEIAW